MDYRRIKFYVICILLVNLLLSCNEKKQFSGYLYPIRENGLYGYIDSVGNRIIEPEFLWVSTFHNGLAMAVVDTIYREEPDSLSYEVGERDTIINEYRMYAKYGYIDKTGDFVIEPKFISYVNMPEKGYVTKDLEGCNNAFYRHSFRNNRAMFYDTTTWKNGYIDAKGNVAIEPKYYYSDPFSEGLAVVRDAVAEPLYTNNACITPSKLRCAYLDTLGNAVTEFKYETLTRFASGRGIGSYKKINKETTEIDDTTIVYETYSIPRLLINREGKVIKNLNFNYDYYGFNRDGISVASDGFFMRSFIGKENISYYFIDINGVFLEPLKGLSDYQLDSLGKCSDIIQVLPNNAKIASVTYFNDGFAGISPDKRHWFVIDKFLLIHGYGDESIFDGFRAFNNGLAAVKKNGKWGFINKKIKEQIPCKYDSCGIVYPFLEEVFEYNIQGEVKKKAYINRRDSLVWESPLYNTEKIENRYSAKSEKDWGEWTYQHKVLNKNLLGTIVGAIVIILIAIIMVGKSNPRKTSKGTNEETMINHKPENEVVAEAILSNVNDVVDDEIQSYPTVGQYTETIKEAAKAPDEYFDKLKHLRPVLDSNGEPIMSSGNFAVVFKMKDEYGKLYAVRCFHRVQQGREKNYRLICEELAKVSSPYLSSIKFYDRELFVESEEYPVLLMDWVDGMTLDKYIRMVIDDKKALIQLVANFKNLAIWLLNQPFAHGDLKPDNILVKNDGSLVLVDYDGMFVPSMQGQKAREIGSPDFRNPSRTEEDFNKDIDKFPIISILLSLELLVENKDYMSQFGEVDRLLFSEKDYRDIDHSKIYKVAFSSYNEDISELATQLKVLVLKGDCDIHLLFQNKEKRDIAKKTNEKIEKKINITIIIYNLIVPLSALCYSKVVPEYNWNLLGLSLIIFTSSIVLYILITFVDILRPYKRHHLYVDEDFVSWGCVFTLWNFLIPVRGFMSSYYDSPWYCTLMIIIIWFCFFNVIGAIFSFSGSWGLRMKIFKTSTEKVIEKEEKEKEIIRNELRNEEQMLSNCQKESKEQKSQSRNDDLPF